MPSYSNQLLKKTIWDYPKMIWTILRCGPTLVCYVSTHKKELDWPYQQRAFKETGIQIGPWWRMRWRWNREILCCKHSQKLTFDTHVTWQIKKANSFLAIIKKTLKMMPMQTFFLVYKTLVWPHFGNANAIRSSLLKEYVTLLENIQLRATHMLGEIRTSS